MENKNNVYPKKDFISGFSDDENNPCEYELECQRMVIRGHYYLQNNPNLAKLIEEKKPSVFSNELKPMIEYMCTDENNEAESFGQTGAMVHYTVIHAYQSFKLGWNDYLKKLME